MPMLTRIAQLAARRPKRIVVAAVVLAVAAGVLGGNVASRLGPYAANDPASQSYKASDRLSRATGLKTDVGIVALVTPASGTKVEQVTRVLRSDSAVGSVASYYSTHDRSMLARDGRSTYVVASFERGADEPDAVDRIQQRLDRISGVTMGGSATAERAVNKTVQDDLARAELL